MTSITSPSVSTVSNADKERAIAIQRGVAAHKHKHPDSPLGVYVGINAGEPIADDDDLFGTSLDGIRPDRCR